MTNPSGEDPSDEIVMRHEIPGLYDGWSCAETKGGRWINRWDPGDRRWRPTQNYIEKMKSLRPKKPRA